MEIWFSSKQHWRLLPRLSPGTRQLHSLTLSYFHRHPDETLALVRTCFYLTNNFLPTYYLFTSLYAVFKELGPRCAFPQGNLPYEPESHCLVPNLGWLIVRHSEAACFTRFIEDMFRRFVCMLAGLGRLSAFLTGLPRSGGPDRT